MITANLKSINNQKYQKIKLHGTLATTELKKQSNRTTRMVKQLTDRNLGEAGGWPVQVYPAGAGYGKVAGCVGGAKLRGN